MKKKEFNSKIKSLLNKKTKLLDIELIKQLSDVDKKLIINYIVRQNNPVVFELIPKNDIEYMNWLNCMGYLYFFINKEKFNMLGRSDHKMKHSINN